MYVCMYACMHIIIIITFARYKCVEYFVVTNFIYTLCMILYVYIMYMYIETSDKNIN